MTKRKQFTKNQKEIVAKKSNYKCVGCDKQLNPNLIYDKTDKEVKGYMDHIIPIADGGSNDLENLQLMCWTCNRIKSGNTMEIFLETLQARNEYESLLEQVAKKLNLNKEDVEYLMKGKAELKRYRFMKEITKLVNVPCQG